MAEHEKVHVICENLCLEEGMTKGQIEEKFATKEVVESLASGSPKGHYTDSAALKAANPDTGVYIATGNGHVYSWTKDGVEAIDLGVYQAAEDSETVNNAVRDLNQLEKSIDLNSDVLVKSSKRIETINNNIIHVVTTSSDYMTTDFIEIPKFIKNIHVVTQTYNGKPCIALTDGNENGVSHIVASYNTTQIKEPEDFWIEVPVNAKYICVTQFAEGVQNADLDKFKIELKYSISDIVDTLGTLDKINESTKKPKKVIIDTDFGGDVDDAIALAVAAWAQRNDKIEILGVAMCKYRTDDGCRSVDAELQSYGITNVNLSADKNFDQGSISGYAASFLNYYHRTNNFDETPVSMYRRILSSLEDDECDIIVIGQLNNINDLLNSEADTYSQLNGISLVNKKVRAMYVMGGSLNYTSLPTNKNGGIFHETTTISSGTTQYPTAVEGTFKAGDVIKFRIVNQTGVIKGAKIYSRLNGTNTPIKNNDLILPNTWYQEILTSDATSIGLYISDANITTAGDIFVDIDQNVVYSNRGEANFCGTEWPITPTGQGGTYVPITDYVLKNFPKDIYFNAVEFNSKVAYDLCNSGLNWYPLYNALRTFAQRYVDTGKYQTLDDALKNSINAWDVLTILACSLNDLDKLGCYEITGSLSIISDTSSSQFGNTYFVLNENEKHHYLIPKYSITDSHKNYYQHIIDSIIEFKSWE